MHILSWNFTILEFCGLWRTRDFSSDWKKHVYNAYTCFSIFLMYTFTLSELIEFVLSIDNVDEVVNNSLMLLSMLGICYKSANLVYKRDQILEVTDLLVNDVCRPQSLEEISIQKRFDARGRHNTLIFGVLSEIAVIAITVGSFLGNVPNRTLPFRAWLPFDHDNFLGFWVAFLHQILAHAMAATIGSIHDTLFHGLMAQACGQLNILKFRLRSMPRMVRENQSKNSGGIAERNALSKCIRHHQEICRFVEMSNNVFSLVIFIQFSVSTFVICVSTYTLSNTSFLSAEFTFVIVYLMCMIVQIFLMCWNGNEVITESLDVGTAAYEMDWSSLEQSTKKDLQIIMARTLYPIKYTSGHVITLSLDSYNSLMKLSYSVYNLLQRTS
nr:olfactory receptor 51 [Gregopimpla kuwanae]